jgi:cyclomaltodextrinase
MPDTPDWVRDAVFYQVFPDRFAASPGVPKPGPLEAWDAPPTIHGFKGGDLLGVAERLDHVVSLGANAIYLTPVFQSASNHRYHTYDYLTVDPLLGGDAALRVLLDAAHARGMRVVLDGVFNHTGRGFWAFHHVLETGAASPYRNWFHFDQDALDRGLPVDAYPDAAMRAGVGLDQPFPGQVEGHSSGGSRARLGYDAWWDLPALPKLNISDPGVREHLWGVAEHWLRFGIDGWRLDVPAEIDDQSFWTEFRRRCRAVNPEAYLVGEIWGVAPDWVSGDRFDALMNYPLAKAILGFVGRESLDEPLLRSHNEYSQIVSLDGDAFARRLRELAEAYAPETLAVQLNLLGSHDTPRVLSVLGRDRDALKLAILLQAALPGAPSIYYGDEVGMEGGRDPDSRRAFSWDEARWDGEILGFTRLAFGVRRALEVLRRGDLSILGSTGAAVVLGRRSATQEVLVAVNAGHGPERVALPDDAIGRHIDPATLLATGDGQAVLEAAARNEPPTLRLPPRWGGVLRLG